MTLAEFRAKIGLAHRLLYHEQQQLLPTANRQSPIGITPMFNRQFLQSRLGQASMISFAAMLALNVFALSAQLHAMPTAYAAAPVAVELA